MVSSGLKFGLFAVWAVGALAAPLAVEKRAISAQLLANFNLFEQFAAAAYCPSNNNQTGSKLTCPGSNNCPLVQADNTYTLTEFANSLLTDVTGYVAVDTTRSLIVAAFRGSESVRNWLADVDFPQEDTDICDGCTAASGFYTSWTEARSGVLAAVISGKAAHPTYQIVTVGHSLGAALADFAAAELRNQGYDVALYTFGSPRIGGETISDYISNQSTKNYRVTHLNDPIPRLPPIAAGFVHISPEYYISTGDYVPVTVNDVYEYTGSINYSGNTGNIDLEINAHRWYFNNITSCYSGDFEF